MGKKHPCIFYFIARSILDCINIGINTMMIPWLSIWEWLKGPRWELFQAGWGIGQGLTKGKGLTNHQHQGEANRGNAHAQHQAVALAQQHVVEVSMRGDWQISWVNVSGEGRMRRPGSRVQKVQCCCNSPKHPEKIKIEIFEISDLISFGTISDLIRCTQSNHHLLPDGSESDQFWWI